jgi:hypothetical protein
MEKPKIEINGSQKSKKIAQNIVKKIRRLDETSKKNFENVQ